MAFGPRRKRVITAFLLACICGAAPVVAFGFHGGDLSDAPGTFVLPAFAPGDQFRYSYSVWDEHGATLRPHGRTVPLADFTMGPATPIAVDGRIVDTRVVEVRAWSTTQAPGDPEKLAYQPARPRLDYWGPDAVVAVASQDSWDIQDDLGPVALTRAFRGENVYVQLAEPGPGMSCWAFDWFGPSLALRHDVEARHACTIWAPSVDVTQPYHLPKNDWEASWPEFWIDVPAGTGFEVLGAAHEDGSVQVVLRHRTADGDAIHVWIDERHSAPSRLTVSLAAAPGRVHLFSLDGVGRGIETGGVVPRGATTPQVAATLAPATPWMLEDRDVDHFFPLHEAWARAQPHGLREWMDTHPEGYIYHIDSWSNPGYHDARASHTWWIHMTVGADPQEPRWDWRDTEGFSIEVRKTVRGVVPTGPAEATLQDTVPDGEPEYVFDTDPLVPFAPPALGRNEAEALTRFLPRLSSLEERFHSWHPEAPAPSLVQFHISHPLGVETEPSVRVAIHAIDHEARNEVAVASGTIERVTDTRLWSLGTDADGEFTWFGTSSYSLGATYVDANGPTQATRLASDPSAIEPPGWSVSGGGAAVGGIVGALVAVLYFFWPALKSGAVGLFSRIKDDEVLDHPVRAQILGVVQADPGIHMAALARRVGKGRTTTEHHLRKLHEAGRIVRQDGKGYTCYYPRNTDRRVVAGGPALRSSTARAIYAAIQQDPGISPGNVAARVGVARPTVHHHLTRLKEAGLIQAERVGKADRLWLGESVNN